MELVPIHFLRILLQSRVLAILAVMSVVATQTTANDLVVNRETGKISWFNLTGEVLDVAAYTIQSPTGSLLPNQWISITENYDADSGGSLDADDTWFVLGGEPSNLSEATLGTTTIGVDAIVDLGNAFDVGQQENLLFEYLDAQLDAILVGSVMFVSPLSGDYNGNGFVEQADLDLVLLNWGELADPVPAGWIQDLPAGHVDQDELDRVLLNWGLLGESQEPAGAALLSAAGIPEAGTFVMAIVILIGLISKSLLHVSRTR